MSILRVISAFSGYSVGQTITDAITISTILAGSNSYKVVQVAGTVTSGGTTSGSTGTGSSGSTGSVSASLTAAGLLTLLETLPTVAPASAGILWLDAGVLTVSAAVSGSVPTNALLTESGLPLQTQSGQYITTH